MTTTGRPAKVFHRPVMVNEVLEYLEPEAGTVVDCCAGGGGHALAILKRLRRGRLLGIDADPEAIASTRRRLGKYENVELVHGSYTEMAAIVRRLELAPVTGVLMDLGVSLHQLQCPERGFGFDSDGPIDMRFDQTARVPSALDLLRRTSLRHLQDWLKFYGEEPFARRIGRRIFERRHELRTTGQLAGIVRSAVPARRARKTLARVFQAFRIATNHELENVRAGLDMALDTLADGGRLVVISYHSLEDRLAKLALREGKRLGKVRILTPKPIRPQEEEVRRNPAARSARLRAGEVLK